MLVTDKTVIRLKMPLTDLIVDTESSYADWLRSLAAVAAQEIQGDGDDEGERLVKALIDASRIVDSIEKEIHNRNNNIEEITEPAERIC